MSVQDVTTSEFETALADAKPLLVDFWAPWCGPCRAVSPVVDEIAGERDDVHVVKVNIDDNQELAVKLGVGAIPTLILFKGGSEIQRIIGAHPKKSIVNTLDVALT
jgi:thioredoxin 1